MSKAKLILLNGFAGSGKTTIAKKYVKEHDLAMLVEADQFVENIGNWAAHRDEARQLVFELVKATTRTYLLSGHDVVLPYIIAVSKEARDFELIARECEASYHEFILYNERADAIAKLLARGKWGIANSTPLTDKDLPIIEQLASDMEATLKERPNMIKIEQKGKDPNTTYRKLIDFLN